MAAMNGCQGGFPAGLKPSPWVDLVGVATWRNDALCRDLGAELFFPAGDQCLEAVEQAEAAKAVCRACPVQGPCLAFALSTKQQFGIWGGRTEEERRRGFRARPQRSAISIVPPAEPVLGLGRIGTIGGLVV